ncbi:hypothetical protein MLD38_023786 [Melastoma candidum]|uniref:Uncharacterized protein n=1 Tax=Melastoma candidum TaxID=119954 RepID=A0ACB9NQ72_9MYRT|nr:hypothetical protein MLD38_023786 [Melastoma candidum]
MSFCSALAFLLINGFHLVEPVSISRELFLTSVIPIGALYSLSLWLSNSAYIYLSVSFIQMLKALMPVAVYSIGVALRKDAFNPRTMLNMLSISLGVTVAAYGKAKFDAWGITLQLGALVFEATCLVMIQILLTSKGINHNPITSLYYVAPCCSVFLLVPWVLVEYPILRDNSSFHLDFWVFRAKCLLRQGKSQFLKPQTARSEVMEGDTMVADYPCRRVRWWACLLSYKIMQAAVYEEEVGQSGKSSPRKAVGLPYVCLCTETLKKRTSPASVLYFGEGESLNGPLAAQRHPRLRRHKQRRDPLYQMRVVF